MSTRYGHDGECHAWRLSAIELEKQKAASPVQPLSALKDSTGDQFVWLLTSNLRL